MSNTNKFFVYLVGLIFLICGLGVAFEMLSIPFSSVVLLLAGIFVLCIHLKFNISFLKYLACFMIPSGFAYLIIAAFRLVDVANFLLIYSSLICSFFAVYIISKKKIFIYISMAIVMFTLHTATKSNMDLNEMIVGYDCFFVGLISTILFIFEYKTIRYMPLLISIVSYIGGVLFFLNAFDIITPIMFKMFISLMFLLVGGFIIICNYIKSKKDNKENCCE